MHAARILGVVVMTLALVFRFYHAPMYTAYRTWLACDGQPPKQCPLVGSALIKHPDYSALCDSCEHWRDQTLTATSCETMSYVLDAYYYYINGRHWSAIAIDDDPNEYAYYWTCVGVEANSLMLGAIGLVFL